MISPIFSSGTRLMVSVMVTDRKINYITDDQDPVAYTVPAVEPLTAEEIQELRRKARG